MKKVFLKAFMLGCLAALGVINTAAQEEAVVATVNDQEILQSELENMVKALSGRMTQYGIDSSNEEVLETIRSAALSKLVEDRLLTQAMTNQGCYNFSEEETAEIASAAQASLEEMTGRCKTYFEEYLQGEEEGLSAIELAESYMSENGYNQEYMENYYKNVLASEKYEQWLMKEEPEITEQQIQAAYEQRVEKSREAYENDIAAFETAMGAAEEVWYHPEGYRAVLQIMLKAEGETDEEKLASVEDETTEIYRRLKEGEEFTALISEYGEDFAFDSEDFLKTGYQVHRDSVIWENEFIDAAFGTEMQEAGDYTHPLIFGDNVHILYYLKDVPDGPVELSEEISTALREELYAEQAEEKVQANLEFLKKEAEIQYVFQGD